MKQVLKRDFVVPVLWMIILVLNAQNFFFWDTIQLASKQAHFFYENRFSQFFLPNDINSGHPPFYGFTLAFFWLLFGKSLVVAHAMNAVFVLGMIFQAHRLGQWFLGAKKAFYVPLVLFCNPIFLGHSILVSPDNALCFLLLLAVNGLLRKKLLQVSVASIFLAMLSMRGMMVVFALFLTELIYYRLRNERLKWSMISKYFPSGFAALLFFAGHYLHNQWLGFHDDSPWAESFQVLDLKGYIRNLGIIAWRMIDFGNVSIILSIIYLLITKRISVIKRADFGAFFMAFTIVFVLPLATFQYLTAHRYFIPLYLWSSILFIVLCIQHNLNKLLLSMILAFLFLGNWWIYPKSISQGWDISLGHLPFYSLVEEMNHYIESEGINEESVGTEFPIKSAAKFLYLDSSAPTYQEGVIGEDKYIIYSKVINDYKVEDYYLLQEKYQLVKKFSKGFISIELYEKR